jgi:fido (protein-threonine AMPylation protein)
MMNVPRLRTLFTIDAVNTDLYNLYELIGSGQSQFEAKGFDVNHLKLLEFQPFVKMLRLLLSKSIHKGKFLGLKINNEVLSPDDFWKFIQECSVEQIPGEIWLVIEHLNLPNSDLQQEIDKKFDSYKKQLFDVGPINAFQMRMTKDLAWTSDAIEGTTVAIHEANELYSGYSSGILDRNRLNDDSFEMVNHFATIENLVLPMAGCHLSDINEPYMKELHRSLDLVHLKPDEKGNYRKVQVTIARRQDPQFSPPADIQEKCDKMFATLHSMNKCDPIYTACWLHYTFVQIHPFLDGNGRVARLLMNTVLVQSGFPLASIQPVIREIYFHSLQFARRAEVSLANNLPLKSGVTSPYGLLVV